MLLPYQAVTSFLQEILTTKALQYYHCVNALSGCYLISTALQEISTAIQETCVNALSGCYLISTEDDRKAILSYWDRVNALSGCYLISTAQQIMLSEELSGVCQCPLGLLPHFYPGKEKIMKKFICMCQCPLGLLPHFYKAIVSRKGERRKYVSMPSRAVTSFLLGQDDDLWKVIETDVSMPSRAVTSFLLRDNNDEYEPAGPCVNALSGCYLISTSKY